MQVREEIWQSSSDLGFFSPRTSSNLSSLTDRTLRPASFRRTLVSYEHSEHSLPGLASLLRVVSIRYLTDVSSKIERIALHLVRRVRNAIDLFPSTVRSAANTTALLRELKRTFAAAPSLAYFVYLLLLSRQPKPVLLKKSIFFRIEWTQTSLYVFTLSSFFDCIMVVEIRYHFVYIYIYYLYMILFVRLSTVHDMTSLRG